MPEPVRRDAPRRSRPLLVALRRALFGVGPVATVRAMLRRATRADPEVARRADGLAASVHPFDAEFRVDTGGFRSWRELQNGGANDPYISGYLGIAPSVARRAIAMIEAPEAQTFVDYGCGKGRALIVASERPFRRVVGVEIASDLAETARRNAEVIAARHGERPPIEIVHGDAADFVAPPGPLVVFFYQPFELPVMRRVLANLATSLEANPRPTTIIYVNPALARLFDRLPWLERGADLSLELEPAERQFAYGGAGRCDAVRLWKARVRSRPR